MAARCLLAILTPTFGQRIAAWRRGYFVSAFVTYILPSCPCTSAHAVLHCVVQVKERLVSNRSAVQVSPRREKKHDDSGRDSLSRLVYCDCCGVKLSNPAIFLCLPFPFCPLCSEAHPSSRLPPPRGFSGYPQPLLFVEGCPRPRPCPSIIVNIPSALQSTLNCPPVSGPSFTCQGTRQRRVASIP